MRSLTTEAKTVAALDSLLPRLGGAVVFAGALAVLLLGALASPATLAAFESGVDCLVLAATGLSCPLCGMTHATLAAGGGELGSAFAAHPLFPLILGFALWGGWKLAWRQPLTIARRNVTVVHVLCGTGIVWIANLVAQWAA